MVSKPQTMHTGGNKLRSQIGIGIESFNPNNGCAGRTNFACGHKILKKNEIIGWTLNI